MLMVMKPGYEAGDDDGDDGSEHHNDEAEAGER